MRQGKKGSLEECSRSKKKKREDYQKSLATTALLEDLFYRDYRHSHEMCSIKVY